ncbi:Hypothetical predicted protein [Marmota monax]|uniref:Uncharacterized protein n=1 Tax=Marmota monax TaxID=9995 RepID=A0A5E4B8T0_MARMO|nr:hypothetical protein GHT09_001818 [Marmota monax]VTJ65122.1 Hypothetical predicted protein [Marmota monax]
MDAQSIKAVEEEPKEKAIKLIAFRLPSEKIGQLNEHHSEGNLNPPSSQQGIGNLFGKPEGEDTFTFSFSSDTSAHTFGTGKDDFSFPFSFEQDQTIPSSSLKGFSSSSQNTAQFTFF